MTPDALIKDACDAWAAEAQVPADLADRALRTRSRRRTAKVSATAVIAAAGLALGLTALPAKPKPHSDPVVMSADTSLRTDLSTGFPRHLVAAGHTAVAAYYTTRSQSSVKTTKAVDWTLTTTTTVMTRTWYLYDPAFRKYQATPWAYLDVAPGMHQAAVLEGPLPASRIGVLDLATRKIVRWIPLANKVGAVSWSPDGRRLVATAYNRNPDVELDYEFRAKRRTGGGNWQLPAGPRTGYYVVDTTTGGTAFHSLAADRDNPGTRQDLGWSRDGTLVWAPTATSPTKVFFDLSGDARPAPPHEAETDTPQEAGLSPNGTLLPAFGPKPGPAVTVTNVTTGKSVAVLPIERALAWADDAGLFAWGCDVKHCRGKGEFTSRLLLVNLNGKITPLTGYQRSGRSGAWTPVFTHR